MNQLAAVERGITFEQMQERAALLRKSGFLPTTLNTDEKVLTVMLTGQELGLGFMESLRSINVVQGKPCMSAQLLIGLCHRTGQVEKAFFEKETDQEAIYVLQRRGSPAYKSSFSIEDARKLGLADKDNYKKQAKTMLSWRAIAKAARVIFPDAVCGLYTPEEIAENVDIIDAVSEKVEIRPTAAQEMKVEATNQAAAELPSVEGANGLINPMELDKLGSVYLKPPYNTQFPDKCIMEIYGTTTPGGKRKGEDFLRMIAEHGKDTEERVMVAKFLEAIKKHEA